MLEFSSRSLGWLPKFNCNGKTPVHTHRAFQSKEKHMLLYCWPVVPNLFGTRNQSHGRKFSTYWGRGGWFQDDSSTLCLLCTLFLVWCHHLIWQEIPECSPEGGNPCSRSLCNSQLGAWSGSGQEMDGLGGSWYSRLKVSKIPFTHMQVNLANKIISIVTHLQISNQSI